MKQYSKYKQSKFKWINAIPSAWVEGRVSYYFEIGRGRAIAETELVENGLYPVYSSQTKNDGCLGFINTFDFENVMLTWTTDGANAGSVFLRSGKFNCTNVCGTLKPKKELFINYYLYYLQYITQFYKRPDTNGAKIMNNEMAGIHILIPTLQEQTQIALYLDHQTSIIDQLISKKQKLLELLKEKRQAIINEAVTKGLNPNAGMKDSGNDSFGMIPENWIVTKLKVIANIKGRIGFRGYTTDDLVEEGNGALTLGATHITWDGDIDLSNPVYISWEKYEESPEIKLEKGDIVIVQRGSTCGKVAIISDEIGKATINPSLVVLKNLKANPFYVFSSIKAALEELVNLTRSAAIPMLSQEQIGNLQIVIPPLDEQNEIESYLKNIKKMFNATISQCSTSIEKLKEYRQSIISEAVTGKIDVREWTPNSKINS